MKHALSIAMVASLALAACAGVLGIRRSSPSHPFEHRAHVTRGINCLECHAGVAAAGDTGPLHLPSTADCVKCHAKPHDPRACDGCHGEPHVRANAALARTHLTFAHAAHLPTTKGDCVRCHVEIAAARPESLRPTMATCFGCHAHEKQWAARDCNGCHVDLATDGLMPASHVVHDGDFVREHGVRAASARDLCSTCHTERSCAACHGATTPALPARLAVGNVALSGLHRAGFRARHADEARAAPSLCTTCHSERSCRDCHASSRVAPGTGARSPHAATWLTAQRGGGEHGMAARMDPAGCASCHGGAGEALCVGCHRVGGPGGNPHGPGFASTKEPRRDLPCRQCHAGAP